jgi:Rdx family
VSLKQDIENKLGIPVRLKAGMPGSMDIYVDKERIYSKAQTGKMPQNAEILSQLERRKNG